MHFVFLAAGKGTRIFSKIKTNKCLIKISNRTIIERLIENIPKGRRNKIVIATGFNRKEILNKTKKFKINYIHNSKFNSTDMVETLRLALKEINDDILFSYSDIIYDKKIITTILKKKINKITVPIKLNWKNIWKIRNKSILEDAESLIVKNGHILEIGKKIQNLKKVDGQFMGLLIIPKTERQRVLKIINNRNFKKYQTTNLLNKLIKSGMKVKVLKSKDHWYEFDDYEDLKNYNNHFNS